MLHQIKMNWINYKRRLAKAVSTKRLTKDSVNKLSILNGAKYFYLGIFQNDLAFLPAKKYIKYFSDITQIESSKSNGLSEKNIENIKKSDRNLAPTFGDHHWLPDMTFNGHCLIKSNVFIPKKVINLYISYKLTPWLRNLKTGFTLNNCLLESLKLTKNADPDKCKYSNYSIGFDYRSELLFTDGRMERNVNIIGADMSSSVHVDNKYKDILILGEGRTQALDDTSLTGEAKYPINFTQPNKGFVLSLFYNTNNISYLLMLQTYTSSKQKSRK